MNQYVREFKIAIPRPPLSEMEAIYAQALESGKYPYLKKAEETKKQPLLKHRFVDNVYFAKHPPAKVKPEKLLEFDRVLPDWIRGDLDTRTPEEARRRLTVLYRLVYASGEMTSVVKSPPAPKATQSPSPKATPPSPPKPF